MSMIEALKNVPEVNFIGNLELEEVKEQVAAWYEQRYKELTGKVPVLSDASPEKLLQYSIAMLGYQALQFINDKGQGELLPTSYGSYLDGLAANVGVTRRGTERATVHLKFTLSAIRASATGIPAGTRVKTADNKFFNTVNYAEIAAGSLTTEVLAQAEEPGTASNGMPVDSINVLVDPIPYMQSVTNTIVSSGGTDVEDDDSLTERVFLAPSTFSSAGPADAYKYFALAWRNDVADVVVISTKPSEVDIFFMLDGGVLPSPEECEEMQDYFNDETKVRRPLTDLVICQAPEEVEYTIQLTYYIAESDRNQASSIQEAVTKAVEEYQSWQRSLGRDVNPSELIYKVRLAGAKRIILTSPTDTVVGSTQIAKCTQTNVTYGGLEDD